MRLEIVVAADCELCEEARHIAQQVQVRVPGLDVEVVELDGTRPVPEHVVATPTYLLDGRVISLGNPRLEPLLRTIADRRCREGRGKSSKGLTA